MIAKEEKDDINLCRRKTVLVCYKPNLKGISTDSIWDTIIYMPWPRYQPLPGPFGVSKRLLRNIHMISKVVGDNPTIHCFSATYDNEAVNYFIYFFKKYSLNCSFSLIPDGALNLVRHPQTLANRLLKTFRVFRSLYSKEIRYTFYKGDRLGADANFIKSIYILNGLNTEYDIKKIIELKHFFLDTKFKKTTSSKKALVVGQPLSGYKLIDNTDLVELSSKVKKWLVREKIEHIYYKTHPKDAQRNLYDESYKLLPSNMAIEKYLANNYFDYVIGVHSSVLIFAKQLYGNESEIVSFGLDKIRFKNPKLKKKILTLFCSLGITIL